MTGTARHTRRLLTHAAGSAAGAPGQRKTARDSRAVLAPILSPPRARLGLTQHRHGSQDAFDETRADLDHLAFAVAGRAELEAWAARLADAAVVHSPITAANSVPGAAVLVFRDPDNIQLELFAEPLSQMPVTRDRRTDQRLDLIKVGA